MTDQNKSKAGDLAKAIGAGIVGAAAGAGAVYLADKKNREKIKDALGRMKEQGQEAASKAASKAQDTLNETRSKAADAMRRSAERIASTDNGKHAAKSSGK